MKLCIVIFSISMLLSGCVTSVGLHPTQDEPQKACLCSYTKSHSRIFERILIVGEEALMWIVQSFDNPKYEELDGERVAFTFAVYKEQVHLKGRPLCPAEVWGEFGPRIPQAVYELSKERGKND